MPADRFFQRHRAAVLLGSILTPLVACALLALVRDAIENTVSLRVARLGWSGRLVPAA